MTDKSSANQQVEAPKIDVSKPHTARVWNYLQGGKDNYPVDREAAEGLSRLLPELAAAARALLISSPEGATDYLHADLEDPDAILEQAARTLDFTQPVALTMLGILNHVIDNDEAYAIVQRLVDALPSGSYLVISHPTTDIHSEAVMAIVNAWNNGGGTPPVTARTRAEIVRYFDGLELLEPGVVSSSLWRPEPSELGTPPEVVEYGGVARKP